MDLDPSPNAGTCCYSIRVSVIANTCNTQRISYLLWSEFLIITQTQFWKKSGVKLIYPNYRAVHLFSRTKISHFSIHKSKFREICKKIGLPRFFIYTFFPSPNSNFSTFWEKWSWTPTGCISVYDSLCVWHSIRQ